jgi:hypothetical protein
MARADQLAGLAGGGVVAQIEGLQAFSDSAAVIRAACSGEPSP